LTQLATSPKDSVAASPGTLVSLVVGTLGRTAELEKLFGSLVHQDHKNFEVIVVDQNSDDRLGYLFSREWPFRLRRFHTPGVRGVCRGRNTGWRACEGELVIFPDDDCWYPPWFLSRGIELMSSSKADILTGRAANEAGHDINGRYSKVPQSINRSNVWTSGIEWMMLFRKSALLAVDGFDETIGVGAATPWQACEAQDIILRALARSLQCTFDPSFYGHHKEFDISTQSKGRAYGRGLGYVLRIHKYGKFAEAMWVCRPIVKIGLSVLKGDLRECSYLLDVSLGRLEGCLGRTL